MTLLGGGSGKALPPPYGTAWSAENRLLTLECEDGGGCM